MDVKAIKIADGVYWVRAIDWNIRDFHGYSTPRGTTCNAYLIVDERVALVDTVKSELFEEMTSRAESVVKLEDIDYVISDHAEMDHSGSIPHIAEQTKNVKVVWTERGKSGLLKHYHGEWDFNSRQHYAADSWGFPYYLSGLRPKGRVIGCFGSYGWGEEALGLWRTK